MPTNKYDLWHDRAVFHFLTDQRDRALYLENLRRALKPGGHVIIATFGEDGPLRCSGLEVERYHIDKLSRTLGNEFELVSTFREEHHTPFGTTQSFVYGYFRLAAQD